jgi:hypothetical protein
MGMRPVHWHSRSCLGAYGERDPSRPAETETWWGGKYSRRLEMVAADYSRGYVQD